MDTIAYLKDPMDATAMIHIVVDHPKFTSVKVKEEMEKQLSLYDKYNKSNDASSRDYLLDSLEKSFRRDVEDQSRDVKSFPELFMVIVRILTDDSIERWEIVKGEMRALVPQQYPGHDITLLTKDFAIKARCLSAARLYEHTLTASFLKNILKAKWPETPKFALLTINQTVQSAVEHIRFMDKSIADTYMANKKLLYTHVAEEANTRYLVALKQREWAAKSNLTDSKTPPASFPPTRPLSLGPLAFQPVWTRHPSMHWSSNSVIHPVPTRLPRVDHRAFQNITKGNGPIELEQRGKQQQKEQQVPARSIFQLEENPPAPGASDERLIDGTKYFWCAKCARWNTTHKTHQHIVGYGRKDKNGNKGRSNKKPMGRTPTANCLEFDASAWNAELDLESEVSAETHDSSSSELLDDGTITSDDAEYEDLPPLVPRYHDSTPCPPYCKLARMADDSDDDDDVDETALVADDDSSSAFADNDSEFDDLSDIIDSYVNDDLKEHKHSRIFFRENKPNKQIVVVVSYGEGVEEAMGRLDIDEALSIRPEDDHIRDFVFVYCDRNIKKQKKNEEKENNTDTKDDDEPATETADVEAADKDDDESTITEGVLALKAMLPLPHHRNTTDDEELVSIDGSASNSSGLFSESTKESSARMMSDDDTTVTDPGDDYQAFRATGIESVTPPKSDDAENPLSVAQLTNLTNLEPKFHVGAELAYENTWKELEEAHLGHFTQDSQLLNDAFANEIAVATTAIQEEGEEENNNELNESVETFGTLPSPIRNSPIRSIPSASMTLFLLPSFCWQSLESSVFLVVPRRR